MNNTTIDIVNLIEKNPLTRLNSSYKTKLVSKIKDNFTNTQQQLFLASFYCYLNCNSQEDFVIDLDTVWKWVGFSRKDPAKRLFLKEFIEDIDYKVENLIPPNGGINLIPPNGGIKNKGHGGDRKSEQILMTVRTFKKFCMKSKTKKADEIHDYYIQLEELVQELVEEESQELRERLTASIKHKENNILTNFENKPVVYIGFINNNIVKFGYSNNIEQRIKDHKKDIKPDFTFEYVYESFYNREIEKKIKKQLKSNIINKVINNKNQTELIQLNDEFTLEKLDTEIKGIKKEIEILEKDKNKNLIIDALKSKLKTMEYENKELNNKINELTLENNKLKEDNKVFQDDKKGMRIVDTQLNSMQSLLMKNKEIKKAICYNFIIHFVANHIKLNDGNCDILVTMLNDDFYNKYKKYKASNRFKDVFDEQYDKTILSKSIKDIHGILTTRNCTGERVRIMNIGTVANWLTENVTIPRHFRNLFIFDCDYYNHKTTVNEDKELEHVYNFLISLILKNTCYTDITRRKNKIYRKIIPQIKHLSILYNIISSEYVKFYLNDNNQFKRLKLTKIYKIIYNIPGICMKRKECNQIKQSMEIDLNNVCPWICSNLNISKNTEKLLEL